jgi:hypothetical protein
MHNVTSNVEQKAEGITLSCVPIYFHGKDHVLVTGGLATENKDSLGFCWVSLVGSSALAVVNNVSSGSASKQFLHLIQYMDHQLKEQTAHQEFPLRALSLQLNTPEMEWKYVPRHHFRLMKLTSEEGLSAQISHLNIPVHPLVQTKGLDLSEFFIRDVAGLPVQQNAEGWFQYYFWLQEDIEVLKEKFFPESVAEYSLEGRFTDFIHEVRGALLKGVEEEIGELTIRLETLHASSIDEIKDLEKEIIRRRFESYRGLQTQQEVLRTLETAVRTVVDIRPEFAELAIKAKALIEFAGMETDPPASKSYRWDQRLLWMALLNTLLGVVTVITCEEDGDRALLWFSVQLSFAQTLQIEGVANVYSMLLQWDALTKILNQLAYQGGRKKVLSWLEAAENEDKNNAQMIVKFRERIWDNLENIYLPIKKLSLIPAENQTGHRMKNGRINPDFLNFLPSYTQITSEGVIKWAPIVKYNENGTAIQLGRLAQRRVGF